MNADKTSIDKKVSCAVAEGHTSTPCTMEKVSHTTHQLNRNNAGGAPAFPSYHSTKGPFLSSETKTDQNTRGSPSPTLEEPTPMNHTAHRFNGVGNCIQPHEDGESTDKGYRLCSYSSTPTIVGTESLASPGPQDDESTDDAHCIETDQGHNGDRAPLSQAGAICQTLKCLTDVCSEEEEDVEEVERRVPFAAAAAAAAAAEASKISRSFRRDEPEPVDDKDRIEAGQGSKGAAAAAAKASKISRSLQRDEPEPVDGNDRIEAGQGSNGDVASYLQVGGSCTKLTTADNVVHDFENISKPLHAAIGATSHLGKDVDEENEISISSTSTEKGTYLLLPEEEKDTAAAAAKIVPKGSAVNETGGSTKEAAVEEVSTYFLKLHCFFLFSFITTSFTKNDKTKILY